MTVTVYGRKAMAKLLSGGALPHAAIISFSHPTDGASCERTLDFSGRCARVIRISLRDLDRKALPDFGLSEATYFPEADELAEFICRAKEEGLDILCQCEYGQSRSAGCAAAILEHFERRGIEIFADDRYYPNQLVYHKVKRALEKRGDGFLGIS